MKSKTHQFGEYEMIMLEKMVLDDLNITIATADPVVALRVMAELLLHKDPRLEKLLADGDINARWRRYSFDRGVDMHDHVYARQLEQKIAGDNNLKVITLPTAEEITSRLAKLQDVAVLHRRFYPKIAHYGGSEVDADLIVAIFVFAIDEFMQQGGYPPVLAASLAAGIPSFIEALIEDKEVADSAKEIWEQFLKEPKTIRESSASSVRK